MDGDIDFDFFDDSSPANQVRVNEVKSPVNKSGDLFESKDSSKVGSSSSSSSRHSSSSSNSDYDSSDDSHNNLHGVNGYKNNTADERETEHKYVQSLSSSTDHRYSDSDLHDGLTSDDDEGSDVYTRQKNHLKSEKNKSKTVNNSRAKYIKSTSISRSGDSSDSVTDVSPLTSPDRSPVLQRHCNITESFDDNDFHISNHEPVRHITKLNVTFKSQEEDGCNCKKEPLLLHADSSKKSDSFKYKVEGTSASVVEHEMDGHDYKQNKQTMLSSDIREGRAALNHRQRLLDSAARGSMDVSSLLETVLEFEKQNFDRKARNSVEPPMNYRIGERMLNDQERKHRKNMSFSNDQVRNIDRENKRLLQEITRQSRPSSASSVRSTTSTRSNVSRCSRVSSSSRSSIKSQSGEKPVKLYHTAINRLQYQRRIERENMQFLRRLQAAKPTPGLQRQRQLTEYKQKSGYMGASIDRSGMSLHRALELTHDAEVVQDAMGIRKTKKRSVKPAWQDSW